MCLAVVLGLLSSCSGTDYLNAIPKKSTALISVDMQQMASGKSDEDKAGMLKSLLHVEDASKCGIDISEKIFLFESADGNLGLCAKVSDEGDVEDWLASLAKQHIATEVKERKGFHFSVLKNSWLVGFSDQALLVMGPVVADAQAQLQQQMVKYLKADEDEGITASPMFERLETITSPMAMVAQAQALPEKFVAPFTLGTPKDTDPSQVVIAAEMDVKDGILQVKGETFSFNKEIYEALKKAAQTYRPIKGSYVKSMPADALAGIFMNVKGEQFLPMMQSNRSLQTLLMGINQAIDMDNIIRSVDGDMAIVLPSIYEIHTPDSSRYFYADGYQEKFEKGEPQKQLSKEFVRQWLIDHNFMGKEGQQVPEMTDEYVNSVSDRYIELYEHIVGQKFNKADNHDDLAARIEKNVTEYLNQK